MNPAHTVQHMKKNKAQSKVLSSKKTLNSMQVVKKILLARGGGSTGGGCM